MGHKCPLATTDLDLKFGIHLNSLQDIKGFSPPEYVTTPSFFQGGNRVNFINLNFQINLRKVKIVHFSFKKCFILSNLLSQSV